MYWYIVADKREGKGVTFTTCRGPYNSERQAMVVLSGLEKQGYIPVDWFESETKDSNEAWHNWLEFRRFEQVGGTKQRFELHRKG